MRTLVLLLASFICAAHTYRRATRKSDTLVSSYEGHPPLYNACETVQVCPAHLGMMISESKRRSGELSPWQSLSALLLGFCPAVSWQLIGVGRTASRDFHGCQVATPVPQVLFKGASQRFRSTSMMPNAAWRPEEDKILMNEVPAFTVGEGSGTVTFWTALVSNNPSLSERTASECNERFTLLARQNGIAEKFGREPRLLSSWSQLEAGRLQGTADGRRVWVNVAKEGRLASGEAYAESVGGRIYELGSKSDSLEIVSSSSSTGLAVSQAPAKTNSSVTNGLVQVFTGQLKSSNDEPLPWFLPYVIPTWGCLFLAEFYVIVRDISASNR